MNHEKKPPPSPRMPPWLFGAGIFKLMTPTQKDLFGYLCHRAHVDKNRRDCWPSRSTIIEETGISSETLARHFRIFRSAGMIFMTKITKEKPLYARRKSRRGMYYEILDERTSHEIARMKEVLTAENAGYFERIKRHKKFYEKSTLKSNRSSQERTTKTEKSVEKSTLKSNSLKTALKSNSSRSTLKSNSSLYKKQDKKQNIIETLEESPKISKQPKTKKSKKQKPKITPEKLSVEFDKTKDAGEKAFQTLIDEIQAKDKVKPANQKTIEGKNHHENQPCEYRKRK